MDVQLTAVDARSGRSADVVLVVEKDSTVADAAGALRDALGLPAFVEGHGPLGPAGAEVWIAGRPVDPTLPMTVSPLREGAVVGLGGPVGLGVHDPDVGGVAEVRVVGGPDAGRVHRLPLGEFVLGSAHDADAYVADGTVAARQARVLVTPQEVRWTATPNPESPCIRLLSARSTPAGFNARLRHDGSRVAVPNVGGKERENPHLHRFGRTR